MESSWDILRSKIEDLIAEKLLKVNNELFEHRDILTRLIEQVNKISGSTNLGADPIYLKPPMMELSIKKPVLDISYDQSSEEYNGITEDIIISHERIEEKIPMSKSSLLESSNAFENSQRSDDLTEVTTEEIEISIDSVSSKKSTDQSKIKKPNETKTKKLEEAKKKHVEDDKKKPEEEKKKPSEEDKKKKIEESKKKKAEELEEAKKKKAEEAENKKKAVEEAKKKKAEEEAEKKQKAEEAKKRKAEEEAEKKQKAEEAKKRKAAEEAEKKNAVEEAKKKKAADEAEKKKAAEEAKKKKVVDESKPVEETKKKKTEDKKEEPKKKKAEEELKKKKTEDKKEELKRKKTEEVSKKKKQEETKGKKPELTKKKTERQEEGQASLVDVHHHTEESIPSSSSETESLGHESPVLSDSEELTQVVGELEHFDDQDQSFPAFELSRSTEYQLMNLNDLGLNITTKPGHKTLWVLSLLVQLLGQDALDSDKVWEKSQEILKKATEQGYEIAIRERIQDFDRSLSNLEKLEKLLKGKKHLLTSEVHSNPLGSRLVMVLREVLQFSGVLTGGPAQYRKEWLGHKKSSLESH